MDADNTLEDDWEYGKFPPAEEDEDDLREGEDGLNFTDPYSNEDFDYELDD